MSMNPLPRVNTAWNPEFDFWKFVASIFILLVHTYSLFGEKVLCHRGWIAVELFLIITGFLFAQSVSKDARPVSSETIGQETWVFLARKFQGLLPFYILGFVGVYLCEGSLLLSPQTHVDALFDFLFLREHGWSSRALQGINWYLSCMLAVQFVLYPLLRWKLKLFSQWFAPATGIFLTGWLISNYGSLGNGFGARTFFASTNLFRAFAEINLGIFAWEVSNWLRETSLCSLSKKILSAGGSLAPVAAFTLASVTLKNRTIPVILLFFFAFVCLSGAGLSAFRSWLPVAACKFLGRLSMVLFLTHTAVRVFLRKSALHLLSFRLLLAARDAKSIAVVLAVYLSLCFLVAIVAMLGWDRIQSRRVRARN